MKAATDLAENNNNTNDVAETCTKTIKRALTNCVSDAAEEVAAAPKKPKISLELLAAEQQLISAETCVTEEIKTKPAHQSPKKRLQITKTTKDVSAPKFIYGNYAHYYGYRNKEKFSDIRLSIFEEQRELFVNKDVLDIGCNNGFITTEIAKRLAVNSIIGIDIDKQLINQAQKNLIKCKKSLPPKGAAAQARNEFPFNVRFVQGNYVLKDDVLLEIERAQYDVILCLSVTKWLQLNFGDAGLKQAFRRMFLQLRSGGRLILEPQDFGTYRRRKNMTETTRIHYQAIQLFPKQFSDFLLSSEIGFTSVQLIAVPEQSAMGFKRPIYVYSKA